MSERYYRCVRAVWQRPCPLSRACARQLPQRGSHWHVGQLSSGRAKHNISETVVLRCLVQRQLDKERCPEAAAPASKARPFASCRASGVQWKVTRPAKASPFGRGVTEGDGEGKPAGKSRCAVIGRLFVRAILSRCLGFAVSGLALSVSLRSPAPPKGEPLACRSAFVWTSEAQYLRNSSAPLSSPAAA